WIVLAASFMAAAAVIVLTQLISSFRIWFNTNLNLMLTMLIGGLWHGASWNFIIWGGLNGLGLVVYKLWRKISPWENKPRWYARAWSIFLTFSFITFTRVWFRAGSTTGWSNMNKSHDISDEFQSALLMLKKIFGNM